MQLGPLGADDLPLRALAERDCVHSQNDAARAKEELKASWNQAHQEVQQAVRNARGAEEHSAVESRVAHEATMAEATRRMHI